MRSAAALCLAALLAGCQALQENAAAYRRAHDVPPGSTLELQRPLEIPARRRNVYIQNGELATYWHVNQYYPYCELILRHSSDAARTLQPGEFLVTRARRIVDMNAGLAPRLVAVSVNGGDDNGPSPWLYALEMYVQSERNPDVERLICGSLQDPTIADYPTVDEIREGLGGLFTLRLRTSDQ